jgi:phytoene synthase
VTIHNAFIEYREQTAPRGSALYYSLLFTPKEKRDAIIALHAFSNELAKITEQNTEKTILQAKLQWWRQEWQRMAEGKAQHPIAKTLASEKSLSPALLQEWIDGALIKLDSDHLCTEKDLSFFCYREMGICAILSAYILGFQQQRSLVGVQDLAESIALVDIMTHLAIHLRRGWCFLPLDWLEQYQVTEEHLQAKNMSPELKALLQQLSNHAQNKFKSGLEKIAREDKTTLLPIIIQATITDKLRQEIVKANFPILHEQISLTPLRKLFITIQTYCRL